MTTTTVTFTYHYHHFARLAAAAEQQYEKPSVEKTHIHLFWVIFNTQNNRDTHGEVAVPGALAFS
jgi:7-cyano-7-deazaguanine synthase in queuosine biosynthesis